METAIAIANANAECPEYKTTTKAMVTMLYNITAFANRDMDLPRFLCRYNWVNERGTITAGYNSIYTHLFGISVGFPSSILAFLLFCRKDFNSNSFLYHRAINVIEFFYALIMLLSTIKWYIGDSEVRKSLFWTMYNCFIWYRLDSSFTTSVEAIIVWVAIERALLCNSPKGFSKINHRYLAYAIIISICLVSFLLYLPSTFVITYTKNNVTGLYDRFPTGFSDSILYQIYSRAVGVLPYLEVCTLAPGAAMTVFGLVQISARKKKLISSAGFHSASSKQLLDQINVNRQLCLLQVCESVPLLLAFSILAYLKAENNMLTMDPLVLSKMSITDAMRILTRVEYFMYASETGNALHVFAHSTHFYRYFLLSVKVRKAVLGFVLRDKVAPSTATSTTK